MAGNEPPSDVRPHPTAIPVLPIAKNELVLTQRRSMLHCKYE